MNKQFDIIAVGSVTQDTYLISNQLFPKSSGKKNGLTFSFPLGTKIELSDVHIEVGGGATNAAATFAQFGFSTAVCVECGDDPSGKFVMDALRTLGIDTSHIRVEKKGRTAYAVFFLAPNGERTVFVYRGASAGLLLNTPRIARANPKWIYATSVGGDEKTLKDIFSFTSQGISIAWNPGKPELARGIHTLAPFLRQTAVLFLNTEEAAHLFGKTTSDESFLKKIRTYTQNVVVITNDREGSRAFVGHAVYRAHIKPVVARDTTGAGDAFGSGFVAGLMQKPGQFSEALFTASANAMSVVRKVGAKHGLVTPKNLSLFKNRIHITQKSYAGI